MAIKPLKSIKFPGLPDTYTVPQVDSVPTQGSNNAVSSGGVYSALHDTDTTLSQSGQAADANVVGHEFKIVANLGSSTGADYSPWTSGKTILNTGKIGGSTKNSACSEFIKIPSYVTAVTVKCNGYKGVVGMYSDNTEESYIDRLFVGETESVAVDLTNTRYIRIAIQSLDISDANTIEIRCSHVLKTTVDAIINDLNKKFGFVKVLTSADDLDDYYETGAYRWLGSNMPIHSPVVDSNCILSVSHGYDDVGHSVQYVSSGSGKFFQRIQYTNGIWGPWIDNQNNSKIDSLKNDLYSSEIFNVSDWENGGISASTGANVSNSSRIRTKVYLPWGTKKIYSTNANVRFLIYAYNSSGTYVGGWWGNGTFNPTDVKGVSSVDFDAIYSNPTYSEYRFRACIYINDDTARVETISDVYIDSLPVFDFIKKSANLTLERVEKIPNNTDFDSLLSAGNYYVENYASISTMLNTPPEAMQGGRLWVGYGVSALRPYQIWLSFSSKNEPYFYMRVYTSSGWGKWNLIKNTEPVNVRVMGYNIGKFNYGYDHTTPRVDNIEEKISNIKRVFGKINPDVMLFAELTDYIDASDTINTNTTLIKPLFKTMVNFHGCASMTNLYGAKKLENDGGVYLRNNNNDYAGAVGRLVCNIGNKKLIISGGFLRVLSSAQDRLEAFKNYIDSITDYDYSVIYLDTNVLSNEEREILYSEAVASGYTVCNGGYFGLINTLVPTDMYKPIDNIFVKGDIKVKNFEVLTSEYDNLASDHLPVVSELTLY